MNAKHDPGASRKILNEFGGHPSPNTLREETCTVKKHENPPKIQNGIKNYVTATHTVSVSPKAIHFLLVSLQHVTLRIIILSS